MSSLDDVAQRGLRAIEEQRYEDAIRLFTEAVALGPERPDVRNALGMAHLHRGDAGSAIPHLEQARTLAEPFDAPEHQSLKREFQLSLATAYQLMDRVDDAQTALRDLIARWPDAVAPRLQLGQLLLSSGRAREGVAVYREAADHLDADQQQSARALTGAVEAFLDSPRHADVFLRAHAESYRAYFDEVAAPQVASGWYAEAARMAPGPDGELVAVVPDGARPYALMRVDLANPADGTVSGVYSESEPMIVAVDGLDPLAQVPILLQWEGAAPFPTWVSTRAPWHWLPIQIQFREPAAAAERVDWIDAVIGAWYLTGFNGEFGEQQVGRFHFVSDPDALGDRGVSYVVDLGRARFDAVPALLQRLATLHQEHPIAQVVFGQGRLPPAS